jgi:hypothetical protein
MDLPNLTTVETNYDPHAEKNAKIIFKWKDPENHWKVTEQMRTNVNIHMTCMISAIR